MEFEVNTANFNTHMGRADRGRFYQTCVRQVQVEVVWSPSERDGVSEYEHAGGPRGVRPTP